MALFPEIDSAKTDKRVREFFDKEWPRILRLSEMSYSDLSLGSPINTGMPKGASVTNSEDSKVVNYISDHDRAVIYVRAVIRAINGLPNSAAYPYRNLLNYRYLKGMTMIAIANSIGLSESQLYFRMRQARVAFADAFEQTYDFRVFNGDEIVKTCKTGGRP